jgi:hypothetical protein
MRAEIPEQVWKRSYSAMNKWQYENMVLSAVPGF